MIGLAGAHRSGKSTLARLVAEKIGIEYLDMDVGQVFKDLGVDPKAMMPFEERLVIQEKILDHIGAKLSLRIGQRFIADRTPYDVLMYTLADVQRGTLDDRLRVKVSAHMDRGYRIVAETLRGVLVLNPLYGLPDAPGKAQTCPIYTGHVNAILQDIVRMPLPNTMVAVTDHLDLNERALDLVSFHNAVLRAGSDSQSTLWTPNS